MMMGRSQLRGGLGGCYPRWVDCTCGWQAILNVHGIVCTTVLQLTLSSYISLVFIYIYFQRLTLSSYLFINPIFITSLMLSSSFYFVRLESGTNCPLVTVLTLTTACSPIATARRLIPLNCSRCRGER